MSKLPYEIKTLAELRARKAELRKKLQVSQTNALASVDPARGKLGSFIMSKATPIAAIGVGLFLATKLFGGKKEEETTQPRITDEQLAFLEAERQERAKDRKTIRRIAAAKPSSPGFTAIVRSFLPFIKVLFPLAQSAFASYQAAQATDLAEDAVAVAEADLESDQIS